MQWCDFYDSFWDWSDSTRRSRISSLEDIGPGEEIVEVILEIGDEKVRSQLIRKAMKLGATFTNDDFMNLECEIPDELYEQLGKYAGYDHNDPYFEEDDLPPRTSRGGFGLGLLAVLSILFSGDSGHRDSHHCDGNCDACPAHYGYRYGRWYYGHGHQRGCERGGNGGRSGRTYRD